jgi:thiamine biosynthesis protein ThiS
MSKSLTVVVNGKEHRLNSPATALDLLESLELDPRAVAVELNKNIVKRATLGEIPLSDGDRIELVHFVGGG